MIMTKIAGSDEAGRGSIIGSLFVAIVMTDEDGLEKLKEMGARDSKMISPGVREQLAEKIKKMAKWKIMRISPNKIDSRFINGTNLNWLEGKTMVNLINAFKPDKAIIDAPSNNISRFHSFLKSHLKTDTELVVEHKADVNHPIVGAASILAKTERDKEMILLIQ
jgi:ribonuclease HII